MRGVGVVAQENREQAILAALADGRPRAERIIRDMFSVAVEFGPPGVGAADTKALSHDSLGLGMRFCGDSEGLGLLDLPWSTASALAASFVGSQSSGGAEALALVPAVGVELANILINAAVGEIGRRLHETYRFDLPVSFGSKFRADLRPADARAYVLAGEVAMDGGAAARLRLTVFMSETRKRR